MEVTHKTVAKNLTESQQDRLLTQLHALVDYAKDKIDRVENIQTITISNATHTLSLTLRK